MLCLMQSLFCGKGTLLAQGQSGVQQNLKVLFCKAASQLVAPRTEWCMGLPLPSCRNGHNPLVGFMKILSAHFSSLLRSLWTAAHPCLSRDPSKTDWFVVSWVLPPRKDLQKMHDISYPSPVLMHSLPTIMIFQKLLSVASKLHQPAPSAPVNASH